MNLSDVELRAILDEGEGRMLEFKRGLPRDDKTARSLCAFANTRGGMLAIGVTDRGEIWGVPQPREIMARLRHIAEERVEPPVRMALQSVSIEGHHVVCCRVPVSRERPHAVVREDGHREIVVRAGSSNRVAQGATLAALRSASGAKHGLDDLERAVLGFVASRTQHGAASGAATVQAFADAHNVGRQRARRAFIALERAGMLVGHGSGARRLYECA